MAERSIADSHIRSQTGASIVAVLREGTLMPNPAAATRLRAGDMVAILGEHQQFSAFAALADAGDSTTTAHQKAS